jgi:hypothetical protein
VLPCIDAPSGEVACGVFHESDARLIAAAPALLEAVRDMLEVGMSVRAESVIWAELRAAYELAVAQDALASCTTPATHNEPAKEGRK